MKIEQIIKDKGGAVITVRETLDLEKLAKLIDDRKIGAVIAEDSEGGIVGVISERDIVRQVARNGEAALKLTVGESMTRDVITITPGHSIDECLSLMTDRRIRHLPVVNDGDLLGIVSIGDLVKHKIAQLASERRALADYIAAP